MMSRVEASRGFFGSEKNENVDNDEYAHLGKGKHWLSLLRVAKREARSDRASSHIQRVPGQAFFQGRLKGAESRRGERERSILSGEREEKLSAVDGMT